MPKKFIEIKDLKKIYFQKKVPVKEALKGITVDIYEGEILSLLGANGAGKTTLSTILASLHPPTSGTILWHGQSIYRNILAYRQILGFCPQKPNIDKTMNVEENLFFAGKCYGMEKAKAKKRTEELLDTFSLNEYAKVDPTFLSGGYKQRFLIARALVHFPKLVILDEPTVGLDPHVRQALWQTIKLLKKEGVSVLLTTHYLDEAEHLSDRVCIIDKGKLRLIDTPEKLKKDFHKKNLEEVFLQLMEEEKTK
jgi:ABC-2 type transport system ATP-binding protein